MEKDLAKFIRGKKGDEEAAGGSGGGSGGGGDGGDGAGPSGSGRADPQATWNAFRWVAELAPRLVGREGGWLPGLESSLQACRGGLHTWDGKRNSAGACVWHISKQRLFRRCTPASISALPNVSIFSLLCHFFLPLAAPQGAADRADGRDAQPL